MKKLLLSLLLSGLFFNCFGQTTYTLDSTVLEIDTVISGLDVPWEIKIGPDGMIWTTERYGIVSRIDPATGLKDTILDLTGVVQQEFESGLLGFEFHKAFPDSNYVYLVYTYGPTSDIKERMVRYDWNGTILNNPLTLLDNLPGNTTHDGSRLLSLPDSTILMTTGDRRTSALSQNVNSLNGKFLRFNPDGSVPSDNPFPGNLVYSWGHRNAQGICLAPDGTIISSEHGWNTDDELNIIQAGGNYGWPDVEGFCDIPGETAFCADSSVIEPLISWFPGAATISPSDLIWYDHSAIPEWEDKLLITFLPGKHLRVVELNASIDSVMSDVTELSGMFGRLRDICYGPDGTIYIATNGASWGNSDPFQHSIIRLRNQSLIVNRDTRLPVANFSVYPNPSEGQIWVETEKGYSGIRYQIFSTAGNIVQEGPLAGPKTLLELPGLSKGLYFLQVIGPNARNSVKKFILN